METIVKAVPGTEAYGQKVLTISGQEIRFDGEGFFSDPRQWSEEGAVTLAEEPELKNLGEAHWTILRFLCEYYFQNGRSPLNRQVKDGTGISLIEMEALFPAASSLAPGDRLVCRIRETASEERCPRSEGLSISTTRPQLFLNRAKSWKR